MRTGKYALGDTLRKAAALALCASLAVSCVGPAALAAETSGGTGNTDWSEESETEDSEEGVLSEDDLRDLIEQGVALGSFDSEEAMLAFLREMDGGDAASDSGMEGPSIDGEYGIMPMSFSSDPVDPKNFQFTVWTANETLQKGQYDTFEDLKDDNNSLPGPNDLHIQVKTDRWGGPPTSGSGVEASGYPQIEGYRLSTVRIKDTIIRRLGTVAVREKTYIYFSALRTAGQMSQIVLSDSYGAGDHPIEVRYVPIEYNITYEVYVDGKEQTETDETFGLEAIFGRRRPLTTTDHNYSFSVTIPAGYTADVSVTDGKDVEKKVYPVDSEGGTAYGNHKLGAEVTYQTQWDGNRRSGAEIDTSASDSPGYYSLTGTYRPADEATADQTVKVTMERKSEIDFDPTFWLESYYVTSGGDRIKPNFVEKERVSLKRNALTENEPGAEVTGGWIGENGSFNYQWVFTTTTANNPRGWILDSLAVNGVSLKIPMKTSQQVETILPSDLKVTLVYLPNGNTRKYILRLENVNRDIVITGGNLTSGDSREVIPEELTGVTAEYWNNGWKPLLQSVPKSMSEFNLSQGTVDPDHHANLRFKLEEGYGWPNDTPKGAVTATINGNNYPSTVGSISNPDANQYYYVALNASSYMNGSGSRIYSLRIKAIPKKYSVVYLDGIRADINKDANVDHVDPDSMPVFNTGTSEDQNLGNYYTLAHGVRSSGTVVIYGDAPVNSDIANGTSEAEFAGWVLTDKNGRPYQWNDGDPYDPDDGKYLPSTQDTLPIGCPIYAPNDALELSDVSQCAAPVNAEDQIYSLYLTALWSAGAANYRYYVTFNYTDEAGVSHERADPGVAGVTAAKFTDRDNAGEGLNYQADQYYLVRRTNYFNLEAGSGLSVAFDTDSAAAQALREAYPWYRYDPLRNGSVGFENQFYWAKVPNGGEVAVWMRSNLGRLTVANTVSGLDRTFTYQAVFQLPENEPETPGNEADFFGTGAGPYTVSYTLGNSSGGKEEGRLALTRGDDGVYIAEFTLSQGQSITFDLPHGTKCAVTEGRVNAYRCEVQCTGGSAQAGGVPAWSGDVTAASVLTVTFENTGTGVVVQKYVQHMNCAPSMTGVEAAGGDEVSYIIRVSNTAPEAVVGPVTVTDHLQVTGLVLKDFAVDPLMEDGGRWDPDSQTITWELNGLEEASVTDLKFKGTLPVTDEEALFKDYSTVSYGGSEEVRSNEVSVTLHPYWLRISKTVTGSGGDKTKAFAFQVSLTAPEKETLKESYSYVYEIGDDVSVHTIAVIDMSGDSKTGTITLYLHDGQSVLVYDLEKDTRYSVKELDSDGYVMTLTHGSLEGEISNKKDDLAFQNFRGAPNLSLVKTVNGTRDISAGTGEELTYTIVVTNTGDAAADSVTLTDRVPDGLLLKEGSFPGGSESGGTITWDLGALPVGGSVSVSFKAVVPSATAATVWRNTASASAGGKESVSNETTVTWRAPTPSDSGVDQWLNAKGHYAYLVGYPDGRFGPADIMTRAQAAQMFYNLLLEKNVPGGVEFDDVDADNWYADAVRTLSAAGVIAGYGNGKFGPDDPLTRAQIVTMAMLFSKGETGACDFTDVPETHWAYPYIAGAVRYGWVVGYGDGRFGPDDPLTRGQAVAIVNHVLGRTADMSYISKNLDRLKTYPDVFPGYWAYGDILEASNGHRYIIRGGEEKWRRVQ